MNHNGSIDPHLRSWVDVDATSDFPIQNLPFGVFSTDEPAGARVGVAIGDQILDLWTIQTHGLIDRRLHLVEDLHAVLGTPEQGRALRIRVAELLESGNDELDAVPNRGLVPQADATMHLPFLVGDYVDFYSSEDHANNVGRMFRPDDPPLFPNWKHLPIGYHGRASTVVISGTQIVRPKGQRKPPDGPPIFGPSVKLDIELEVGFFTGPESKLGFTIPVARAENKHRRRRTRQRLVGS